MNYIAGPVLFVVLSVSIYLKLKNETSLDEARILFANLLSATNIYFLILLFVLMLLNWGMEAGKWYVLISRVQKINYFTAYKAVLSGVSFSMFIPNGIGDYAGRLVYMEEGRRLKSLTLTLVGSMAQLTITLCGGFVGLIFLKNTAWSATDSMNGVSAYFVNTIIVLLGIGILLMGFIFYRLNWLTLIFEKLPVVHKYRFMFENLETISRTDLTRILLLSFVRFVIFILQYLLMLHIFNVHLNIADACATVAVLFLVLAILPTIPVADVGVRGEAGLQLFGILGANKLAIVATTAGIWLLNLIIPAVAGSLFIIGIKLFRNR